MTPDAFTTQSQNAPVEPSAGLFDRIISAINLEQEFKKTKKILFGFFILLVSSLTALPFSLYILFDQWKTSGIFYFITTGLENMGVISKIWQTFMLSILEALPVVGISLLAINIAILLFTIRLFLYRKGLLLKYIGHHFDIEVTS